MVIHPLHELCLRARAAKVQMCEQTLQICNSALPIHPRRTTRFLEQAFNFTIHSGSHHAKMLLTFREWLQPAVT